MEELQNSLWSGILGGIECRRKEVGNDNAVNCVAWSGRKMRSKVVHELVERVRGYGLVLEFKVWLGY